MSERAEDRPDAAGAEEPPENPTDAELEVEGPNESAPGHEPSEGEAEAGREAPPPAPDR
jgi:hypothetical protein